MEASFYAVRQFPFVVSILDFENEKSRMLLSFFREASAPRQPPPLILRVFLFILAHGRPASRTYVPRAGVHAKYF